MIVLAIITTIKAKIELWKKIKSSMGNGVKKKLPVPRWVYV